MSMRGPLFRSAPGHPDVVGHHRCSAVGVVKRSGPVRRWVATRLVFAASRIDPYGAFRRTSMTFEYVEGVGVEWRWGGDGCPLWYYGRDDYDKAWTHAGHPPKGNPVHERQL